MLGSLFLGAFLAIAPTTTSLPIPPSQPLTYLEAHLSPYTDELSARDPYTYPQPATTTKQVVTIIREVFGKDAPKLIKIATCESGLSATSTKIVTKESSTTRPEFSIGLFQVNILAHQVDPDLLYDPEYNTRYAKTLYDKEGFTPWFNCGTKLGFIP